MRSFCSSAKKGAPAAPPPPSRPPSRSPSPPPPGPPPAPPEGTAPEGAAPAGRLVVVVASAPAGEAVAAHVDLLHPGLAPGGTGAPPTVGGPRPATRGRTRAFAQGRTARGPDGGPRSGAGAPTVTPVPVPTRPPGVGRRDGRAAPDGPVVTLADVVGAPLDVAACLGAVQDPGCGGTAVFLGTVRDDDAGRRVLGLLYEAHPDAADVLARTAAEVATRHPACRRVAVVHRTGDLAVGEVAVRRRGGRGAPCRGLRGGAGPRGRRQGGGAGVEVLAVRRRHARVGGQRLTPRRAGPRPRRPAARRVPRVQELLSLPGVTTLLWLAPVPLAALWAAGAAGLRSRRGPAAARGPAGRAPAAAGRPGPPRALS